MAEHLMDQSTADNHKFPSDLDPKDLVTLHELCDTCQRFADTCPMLDELLSDDLSSDVERDDLDQTWRFEGCTFAQSRANHGICHLCMLIIAEVDSALKTWTREIVDAPREHDKIVLEVRRSYDHHGRVVNLSVNLMGALHYKTWFQIHKERMRDSKERGSSNLRSLEVGFLQVLPRQISRYSRECHRFGSQTADQTQKPTRLLELSDSGGIRLVCDVADCGTQYLTLSHIWGNAKQACLTSARLEEFQREISKDELPYIYREAVRITRFLGFRFLWIDSLCIIQDSVSDWQQEANKMATVYGNSVCNIAYLFPPGDDEPRPRDDPRTMAKCVLRTAADRMRVVYMQRRQLWKYEWLNRQSWPLTSRAWVLQEQYLAARTLYYGHRNIVWECVETTQDELLGSVRVIIDTEPLVMFRKATNKDLLIDAATGVRLWDFARSWTNIVRTYRKRTLTVPGDRAIALAGVARAMHKLSGLTYCAGGWVEYLPIFLLWAIDNVRSKNLGITITEQPIPMVPSWSFFSSPIIEGEDFQFPFVQHNYIHLFKRVYCASIMSCRSPQSPDTDALQHIYHDFAGIEIILETMTTTLPTANQSWCGLGKYLKTYLQELFSSWGKLEYNVIVDYREDMSVVPPSVLLSHIYEAELKRDIGQGTSKRRILGGLILQADVQGMKWTRLGIWTAHIWYETPEALLRLQEFSESSIMVGMEGWESNTITLV